MDLQTDQVAVDDQQNGDVQQMDEMNDGVDHSRKPKERKGLLAQLQKFLFRRGDEVEPDENLMGKGDENGAPLQKKKRSFFARLFRKRNKNKYELDEWDQERHDGVHEWYDDENVDLQNFDFNDPNEAEEKIEQEQQETSETTPIDEQPSQQQIESQMQSENPAFYMEQLGSEKGQSMKVDEEAAAAQAPSLVLDSARDVENVQFNFPMGGKLKSIPEEIVPFKFEDECKQQLASYTCNDETNISRTIISQIKDDDTIVQATVDDFVA